MLIKYYTGYRNSERQYITATRITEHDFYHHTIEDVNRQERYMMRVSSTLWAEIPANQAKG